MVDLGLAFKAHTIVETMEDAVRMAFRGPRLNLPETNLQADSAGE